MQNFLPLPPDLNDFIIENECKNDFDIHQRRYSGVISALKDVVPYWTAEFPQYVCFVFPGHERLKRVENWMRGRRDNAYLWVYESANLHTKTKRTYPRMSIDEVLEGTNRILWL
jgi:hypothetical protein